ncbi:hypothetical protein GF348_24420 [candidate division KSB3 bacterium]|nr:hypothetical protein [candidate division KSB3 bacterium]
MRIFIITMDDPLQTNKFIKQIIQHRKQDIIGLAVPKGDRLTIGKKHSKGGYLLSLFMIMGPIHFMGNAFKVINYKIREQFSKYFPFIASASIKSFAENAGIQTYKIKSPNGKKFLDELKEMRPDVIINQSQCILKKDLLSIPKMGVINRHNALLPKNRGRLSPFWVLYKKEKETGVSIHFVEAELDSGDIIVQKKVDVDKIDNFNSLVKKSYQIAADAMLEALDKLENQDFEPIHNDDSRATYNSIPTFRDAMKYRFSRISGLFKRIQAS